MSERTTLPHTEPPPREGNLIPNVELPRSGGETVRLRGFRGRRALAICFTHRAGCAPCGAFLLGGLDVYAEYAAAGAELIVIVPDAPEAAVDLQHALALPFPVLSDADGTASRRYGLAPGIDAAVLVADRYGEPRIWRRSDEHHALPEHAELLAELRYLSVTCSGGGARPLWEADR